MFFAEKLAEGNIRVETLVVNRLHPQFGPADQAGGQAATPPPGSPLGILYGNLAQFRDVAEREERHFAALAGRVAPAPVVRVPYLAADVHDMEGLASIAAHLFGRGQDPEGRDGARGGGAAAD